jgi:hypothetical protein
MDELAALPSVVFEYSPHGYCFAQPVLTLGVRRHDGAAGRRPSAAVPLCPAALREKTGRGAERSPDVAEAPRPIAFQGR